MNLQFTPARREKLADTLYGQILEQIVKGRLQEGARLPSESEICRAFKVSRPVVRQALLRLQVDGMIYSRRGSGSFVKHCPPALLTDFAAASDVAGLLRGFEARMALEPAIAGFAAERAAPEQIESVAEALAAIERAFAAGENGRDEDFVFHRAIAQATGNELFTVLFDAMHDIVLRAMELAHRLTKVGSQERRDYVIAEHRQIYAAIASHDRAGATLLMHYHLLQAKNRTTDSHHQP